MPGLLDHPATVPSGAAIIASLMLNSLVLLPIILRATNEIENRIIVIEQTVLRLPPEALINRLDDLEAEIPAVKSMVIESTRDRYHAETAKEVHESLSVRIGALETTLRGNYEGRDR